MANQQPNLSYYHVQKLHHLFAQKLSRDPQYSWRTFARELEVSPSMLCEVMKGKKGISSDKAEKICRKLNLTSRHRNLFKLSLAAGFARQPRKREVAQAQLLQERAKLNLSQEIKPHELSGLAIWWLFPLLELFELEDFKLNEKWMSERLEVEEQQVKAVLGELKSRGWIQEENGKYKPTYQECETTYDVTSSLLQGLHSQFLAKAQQALNLQTVEEREFLNMTLSFSKNKVAEAKAAIRQFQHDFANQFGASDQSKDSIYQLSVQFFRLDKTLKNQEK